MAKIFPTLENIERLKVKPTEGELFLIRYLIDNLSDDIEIYFQPFLNGDMPDIILMQKNVGVSIIEVKDWNLDLYKIDENNKWYLKQNNALLKSPFQQVFSYKDNLFNLHINGLLKEKIKNKQFYGRIQPYVYFHKATKKDIDIFYSTILNYYRNLEQGCHNDFRSKKISFDNYEKKLEYLKQKKSKIDRDIRYYAVGNNNLQKIILPKETSSLFTEAIYKEFHRYLQPPYHTLQQGIDIQYSKKQEKLIVSESIHQKIKGVAGSGKTVVLAKRAVNAHKRHNGTVLVLTFNITLKSYIHDKISNVRDNFSWKYFYITNYHQLITQLLNNLNIDFELPENINNDEISNYLDKNYFSNTKLFEKYHENIPKFKSIFIDEIQDYKPEWIKIIREYFLEKDSEMILFGDEKQNIYNRELDNEQKPKIVQGFGRWEYLNKSIRHQGDGGRILNLAKRFQKSFFDKKYEIDTYDDSSNTPSLNLGIYKIKHYQNDRLNILVKSIYEEIRQNNIQPNDISILSSNVNLLREIDYIIRTKYNENTLTTFETKEMFERINKKEIEKIRKNKKIGFNLNSGVMKISTIHSFKGYETPTLFLIIDENDNEEMVYAGITRSKFDIMVFTKEDSKYNNFFNIDLDKGL
ncbi:AAA family ATPase [Halarcobacter sp.]|uniref:AAA family ATPase n=1 Tax=Halarcobacter sp. TaxID=2321133 RepID=UPI0029F47DA7|nr:AAA family ATPase [Halarcobacter sp.]